MFSRPHHRLVRQLEKGRSFSLPCILDIYRNGCPNQAKRPFYFGLGGRAKRHVPSLTITTSYLDCKDFLSGPTTTWPKLCLHLDGSSSWRERLNPRLCRSSSSGFLDRCASCGGAAVTDPRPRGADADDRDRNRLRPVRAGSIRNSLR